LICEKPPAPTRRANTTAAADPEPTTRWHETSQGRFKVSTPELTALELGALLSRLGHSQRANGVADWLATRAE
jgi:hypothetical protein